MFSGQFGSPWGHETYDSGNKAALLKAGDDSVVSPLGGMNPKVHEKPFCVYSARTSSDRPQTA